jgi:phage gpG-like protein
MQPDMVTIGTDIAYAIVHEEGATIRGNPLLHFKVPVYTTSKKTGKVRQSGSKWIYAHKVTIPARPFGDLTKEDIKELNDTISNYYESIL